MRAGLCDSCVHQRQIAASAGQRYSFCERSKDDEHFPKYPRLPVIACIGYEAKDESIVSRKPEPNASPKA